MWDREKLAISKCAYHGWEVYHYSWDNPIEFGFGPANYAAACTYAGEYVDAYTKRNNNTTISATE